MVYSRSLILFKREIVIFINGVAIALLVLWPKVCCAQTKDDNVVIDLKEQVFTYKISSKSVVLEEQITANYKCIGKPEKITVVEFYDDQTEIRKIHVKGLKGIAPRFEMYQQENIFYSDAKVCYFPLPFKSGNEVAQVYFEKLYKDIRCFSTVFLTEPQFVRCKVVKFVVPGWIQVDIIERNFGANVNKNVVKDSKTNTTTYIYTIDNQRAMVKEPEMPGYKYIYPYLLVVPKQATFGEIRTSYFDRFDHLYKWYRDIAYMTSNDTTVVGTLARDITRECRTDEEKIKEIYAWVQDNIRYLAFVNGLAAFKPDDAHEVLRKKYGDCKGMANLLKALLRAEGFDARLAWIGTREVIFDDSAPLPMANHMICVLFWNGRILFLDPTIRYMALGEYHEGIQGRAALVEDGKNYLWKRVPEVTPVLNADSVCRKYKISGDTLVGKAQMVCTGEFKHVMMSSIYALETQRRNDALKKYLEKGRVQDKVSDIVITGTDSKSEKIEICFSESRKSGIQLSGDELYIDMDAQLDYIDAVIDTAKREHDYLFPFKEYIVREGYVEIPAGYKVTRLPENLKIERFGYSIYITYSIEDNRIKYYKRIVILDTWLKKDQFVLWNADVTMLRKYYMEQVILKKVIYEKRI